MRSRRPILRDSIRNEKVMTRKSARSLSGETAETADKNEADQEEPGPAKDKI